MSRRITFSVDEINSEKAIQPRQDDPVTRLTRSPEEDLSKRESQLEDDHLRITVINVAATQKEVLNAGQTVSFEVDHRRYTLDIGFVQNQPQNTAIHMEVIAEGCTAAGPNKSDHRLVELILKRIDTLVFDCFAKKFAETSGVETAKALVAVVKWLAFFMFIALLLMLNGR
jgi:hypothetical protein